MFDILITFLTIIFGIILLFIIILAMMLMFGLYSVVKEAAKKIKEERAMKHGRN